MTPLPSTDDFAAEAALALPCAFMTEQWGGSHVFKVGDADAFKMFAVLLPGRNRLTVKTPSQAIADMLIEAGVAERNVHLPRGGWAALHLDRLEPGDVGDRMRESHALAAQGMTRAMREKFGLS